MPDAIVTTLLNTGLRVDELIHLIWDDVTLLPRSGKAAIRKGKGDKARTVPLNTLVRDALNGVRPALLEGQIFCGRRGPYTDRGIRNLWLCSGVAPMCRTSTRIGSGTTRPVVWWSMSICPQSQPCWDTADSIRCGSTRNLTTPPWSGLRRASLEPDAHAWPWGAGRVVRTPEPAEDRLQFVPRRSTSGFLSRIRWPTRSVRRPNGRGLAPIGRHHESGRSCVCSCPSG
jgi:hypothetical protein